MSEERVLELPINIILFYYLKHYLLVFYRWLRFPLPRLESTVTPSVTLLLSIFSLLRSSKILFLLPTIVMCVSHDLRKHL